MSLKSQPWRPWDCPKPQWMRVRGDSMAQKKIDNTRRTLMIAGFGAVSVTALAQLIKLPAPEPYVRPEPAVRMPERPPELSLETLPGSWPKHPGMGVHLSETSHTTLSERWNDLAYTWQPAGPMPPIFSTKLPDNIGDLDSDSRKRLFFMILAPHVVYANAILALRRQKLLDLDSRDPATYTSEERAFVAALAKSMRFKAQSKDRVKRLLNHVDVIPTSLALAQAAVESGWGTSRFAQQGNALFGVWTWDESQGIVPLGREEGKTHAVKAYPNLFATVTDYMDNLNRHPAYKLLRDVRRQARTAGQTPSGHDMAAGLLDYSARREIYIEELRTLIRINKLGPTDTAQIDLDYQPPTPST